MLTVGGALTGLALSFAILQYTAAGVAGMADQTTGSQTSEIHRIMVDEFSRKMSDALSDPSLSMIIQDPKVGLYKTQDSQSLESAIARTREAIQVSVTITCHPRFMPSESPIRDGAVRGQLHWCRASLAH